MEGVFFVGVIGLAIGAISAACIDALWYGFATVFLFAPPTSDQLQGVPMLSMPLCLLATWAFLAWAVTT